MIKNCTICSAEFEVKTKRLYCSDSCRREKNRVRSNAWSAANKERVSRYNHAARVRRRENGKLQKYQIERRKTPEGYVDRFMERIKLRNPDTDLTREFFKDKMELCAITGYKFTYKKDGDFYHNPTCPSIDRIDSNYGYYSWNTQIVLSCINRMKNDLPQNDFDKLWEALTA